MNMRKVLAIIGALITGGLGITLLNTAQEASAAMTSNQEREMREMRKILAIIAALITGGLGIAVVGTAQEASALLSTN